jgi:thymidylate synthase
MVSAWNVGELDQMVLPPCHYGFQVYTRELSLEERKNLVPPIPNLFTHEDCDAINLPKRAISLMFNMRSNDVPLGLPFNLASYGLLLEIISKNVNMVPWELITNIGDAHVYLNQIEGVKEQMTRTPYKLPTVKISDRIINDISEYKIEDFILQNYLYHPTIKMPLSN